MEIKDVCLSGCGLRLNTAGFQSSEIMIPSIQKGMMAQTHFIISGSTRVASALRVSLKGAEGHGKPDFEAARTKLAVERDACPYGCSEAQWWEYCVSPHSYLGLGQGKYQVGLNFFNRFLHIDIENGRAELVDPKADNEMLSTTNWFDPKRREIWFASWPVEASVRRINHPLDEVRTTVWKYSIDEDRSERVWQGDLGDGLHQLSLSSDQRFLVLTELGLRFSGPIPASSQEQDPMAWRRLRDHGIIPSATLVWDRKTGGEWRLSIPTAGHVEFDPVDSDVFYLSGHNIGLIGPRVGIFGNGVIRKYRLCETGPQLLGEFTHPLFHRITTHIVFRHQDRTLIGVSGYPGTVFLIDAASMTLFKTLDLDATDGVNTTDSPHICREDSYGIAAAEDGESLIITGSGWVRLADIGKGCVISKEIIDEYPPNSCFTGHMGLSVISGKE